jgi:hypothetical protein
MPVSARPGTSARALGRPAQSRRRDYPRRAYRLGRPAVARGAACRLGAAQNPLNFPPISKKFPPRFLKTFLRVLKIGFLFSGSAIVADDFSR